MSDATPDQNTTSDASVKPGVEFFKFDTPKADTQAESPSDEGEATPSADQVENSEPQKPDTSEPERYGADAYKKLQAEFTRASQKAKELEDKVSSLEKAIPKPEEPKVDKSQIIDKFFEDPESVIAEIAERRLKTKIEPMEQRSREQEMLAACNAFVEQYPDVQEYQEDMTPLVQDLMSKGFSINKALEIGYKTVKSDKLPDVISKAKAKANDIRNQSVKSAHTERATSPSRVRNNGDDDIPDELKDLMNLKSSSKRRIF